MAGCMISDSAIVVKRRTVRRAVRRRILAEHPRCAYCGEDLTDRNRRKATVDHVVPVSRGGLNQVQNLVAACGCCNRCKQNQTVEEWITDLIAAAERIREMQDTEIPAEELVG